MPDFLNYYVVTGCNAFRGDLEELIVRWLLVPGGKELRDPARAVLL